MVLLPPKPITDARPRTLIHHYKLFIGIHTMPFGTQIPQYQYAGTMEKLLNPVFDEPLMELAGKKI